MNCRPCPKLTNDCIFNVSDDELGHALKVLSMTSLFKERSVTRAPLKKQRASINVPVRHSCSHLHGYFNPSSNFSACK
jgi:hypothetical protein